MSDLTPLINTGIVIFLIVFVPSLFAALYFVLRPFLASRLGPDKLLLIERTALMVVRAVEQIGKNLGWEGEHKKVMAFNLLKSLLASLKVSIDEDVLENFLDTFIEGSVQKIRAEAKPSIEHAIANYELVEGGPTTAVGEDQPS